MRWKKRKPAKFDDREPCRACGAPILSCCKSLVNDKTRCCKRCSHLEQEKR